MPQVERGICRARCLEHGTGEGFDAENLSADFPPYLRRLETKRAYQACSSQNAEDFLVNPDKSFSELSLC